MAADNRNRRRGLFLLGLTGASVAGLYAVATPFVTPALRKHCLPFVPATLRQSAMVIRHLKRLSTKKPGTMVDLGSGDGRLVIAAAKRGFVASGYELNLWLVWFSRIMAWRRGVYQLACFYRRDLFKAPLSQFDNIVIFGVDGIMGDIEKMIVREARPGTRVLACRFCLPTLDSNEKYGSGVDSMWIYDLGLKQRT